MAAKKSRSHLVLMRVTFDKPCTAAHAVREAKDCIHGEFYPTSLREGDPGTMTVRTIMRAPAK